MSALWALIGLLIIIALIAGVFLGGAELLNPSVHRAKADKLEAEAAALRAQTAFEERQRRIELDAAEQKAAVEVQALKDRRAMQLALMEPAAIVVMIVGSIVGLAVSAALSYHIIAGAGAGREGSVSKRKPSTHRKAVSSSLRQKQEENSRNDRDLASLGTTSASLSDITYDSFLAYFCSHILYPVRTQVSYSMRIGPEIEEIYLTLLTEAQIITWETSGHAGWVLSRQIRGVEDVRRQVPPRVFYSLVSACRT